MQFQTVRDFVRARPKLPAGVTAIVLCDSPRQAQNTVSHLLDQGAGLVVTIGDCGALEVDGRPHVQIAEPPTVRPYKMLTQVLGGLEGRWIVWLWAGEFLFYPFAESRNLAELTSFLSDERRRVLYCYALDLYGQAMPSGGDDPRAIELYFDDIGYQPFPMDDKCLNLHGSLGWRFEELSTRDMHQIGRSSLIKADAGLTLDRFWRFGAPEMDSVACPWHNSPTGAVMSLRRAYRIVAHPGFPDVADDLIWQGSVRFEWSSRQLLERGMIEPGQWF